MLVNALLMLKFAALFVPGFEVRGLWPAFWGALILSLLNMAVRQVLKIPGPITLPAPNEREPALYVP